jgi:hypothetical protein
MILIMGIHSVFFESPPFLEKKLGKEAFAGIPPKPGIYRFFDADGNLLYVGKSNNLRKPLFSYKRKRAGKTSRKESQLISKISYFEFDQLQSEEEALLEENRWIRTNRPPFNHANKQTEAYYFIRISSLPGALRFSLSMDPELARESYLKQTPLFGNSRQHLPNSAPSTVYGCFKGHGPARKSFGALLQLLWLHQTR